MPYLTVQDLIDDKHVSLIILQYELKQADIKSSAKTRTDFANVIWKSPSKATILQNIWNSTSAKRKAAEQVKKAKEATEKAREKAKEVVNNAREKGKEMVGKATGKLQDAKKTEALIKSDLKLMQGLKL
jgi:transposase